MSGPWWTKFIVLVGAILASIVLLVPTIYPSLSSSVDPDADPETWPSWYSALDERINHITLGLDLQGGLHLQYQVDVDKAISDRLDRFARDLENDIAENFPGSDVNVERIDSAMALRIIATDGDPRDMIDDDTLTLMSLNPVVESSGVLRLDLDSDYIEQTREYALDQAIATIRRRIDAMGLSEPVISRRGASDIIIQLPGLSEGDFDQVKDLIGTTAQLEFRMLHPDDATFFLGVDIPADMADDYTEIGRRPMSTTLEGIQALFELPQNAPPDGAVVRYLEVDDYNAETGLMELAGYQPYLVEDHVELTGEYITEARVQTNPQTNRPYVGLTFDARGGRLFGDMTSEHVGEQMAILLDEIISSAPVINEPILGGRASINMGAGGAYNESFREAESLVIVLRNGALPAPIEKQFETEVGATLGADSVAAGELSLLVGFGLVFIFVLLYYKKSGIITNFALLLNILFMMAILAMFGATLTLPGIAGITLTVGMAVDANVIIFERIKEELRIGKSARAAVDAGYDKAMSAILDANITTAIASIVLMQYGSGPIKGFAVTLLVGIICSLYTAIIVTRLLFEYLIDGKKISRLSI